MLLGKLLSLVGYVIAKAFISAGCESVLTTGSALQSCWDLQLLDGQAEAPCSSTTPPPVIVKPLMAWRNIQLVVVNFDWSVGALRTTWILKVLRPFHSPLKWTGSLWNHHFSPSIPLACILPCNQYCLRTVYVLKLPNSQTHAAVNKLSFNFHQYGSWKFVTTNLIAQLVAPRLLVGCVYTMNN